MLLADPGTERPRVLRVLSGAPDVRPDSGVETRFWLTTPHGEAQINIGSKDPVESVHLELPRIEAPLIEAATRRALELGAQLEMRVEDVQWGHEITAERLPELRSYWASLKPPTLEPPTRSRAWWKPW